LSVQLGGGGCLWWVKYLRVPCLHCCLLFACILVVVHMFVAASNPLSNVFGGVVHYFLHGGVGYKWAQVGVMLSFMKDTLYGSLQLRAVGLCQYWRMEVAVACFP